MHLSCKASPLLPSMANAPFVPKSPSVKTLASLQPKRSHRGWDVQDGFYLKCGSTTLDYPRSLTPCSQVQPCLTARYPAVQAQTKMQQQGSPHTSATMQACVRLSIFQTHAHLSCLFNIRSVYMCTDATGAAAANATTLQVVPPLRHQCSIHLQAVDRRDQQCNSVSPGEGRKRCVVRALLCPPSRRRGRLRTCGAALPDTDHPLQQRNSMHMSDPH